MKPWRTKQCFLNYSHPYFPFLPLCYKCYDILLDGVDRINTESEMPADNKEAKLFERKKKLCNELADPNRRRSLSAISEDIRAVNEKLKKSGLRTLPVISQEIRDANEKLMKSGLRHRPKIPEEVESSSSKHTDAVDKPTKATSRKSSEKTKAKKAKSNKNKTKRIKKAKKRVPRSVRAFQGGAPGLGKRR